MIYIPQLLESVSSPEHTFFYKSFPQRICPFSQSVIITLRHTSLALAFLELLHRNDLYRRRDAPVGCIHDMGKDLG